MSFAKLTNKLPAFLETMGAKLGLCCHREVGNLPALPRRERGARLA